MSFYVRFLGFLASHRYEKHKNSINVHFTGRDVRSLMKRSSILNSRQNLFIISNRSTSYRPIGETRLPSRTRPWIQYFVVPQKISPYIPSPLPYFVFSLPTRPAPDGPLTCQGNIVSPGDPLKFTELYCIPGCKKVYILFGGDYDGLSSLNKESTTLLAGVDLPSEKWRKTTVPDKY